MVLEILNTGETQRIFCNVCDQETDHMCKGEHYDTQRPDEFYRYRLYVCLQCRTGIVEEFYTNVDMCSEPGRYQYSVSELDEIVSGLEDGQDINDEEIYGEYHYSPKRSQFNLKSKEFQNVPKKLRLMYHEVITAFNNKLPLLCAVGIRALLEGICAAQNIPGNTLKNKIDGLNTVLGQEIADHLHSIRFLGNIAAHELEEPRKEEVSLAIEVCEMILTLFYEYINELNQKTRSLDNLYKTRGNPPQTLWKGFKKSDWD